MANDKEPDLVAKLNEAGKRSAERGPLLPDEIKYSDKRGIRDAAVTGKPPVQYTKNNDFKLKDPKLYTEDEIEAMIRQKRGIAEVPLGTISITGLGEPTTKPGGGKNAGNN